MSAAARVTRLSVTPIKGLQLSHPDEVWIDRSGARGDRDFFLVDASDTLISITRTGGLVGLTAEVDAAGVLRLRGSDGRTWEEEIALGAQVGANFFGERTVPGRVVEGPWAELFSSLAGEPVRLVRAEEPGAGSDVEPVTLLGGASVAELSRRAGEPVDARRFRMLVELETDEPHVEDTWAGRVLEGPGVALRVGAQVPRCAAVTRHPDRGDRDLPAVRLIRDYRGVQESGGERGVMFGVYAAVLREGPLRVGEELALQA